MHATWTPELEQWTRELARTHGFDLAGIAPAPPADSPEGQPTAERFREFIDHGRAGEMEYLKRRADSGELLRTSARVALPWARSVLVCAMNYNADAPRSIDPAAGDQAWIARYAWNGRRASPITANEHSDQAPLALLAPTDYHDDLLARLKALEAGLKARIPCQTRCYVDTGPLLERDFAARAGIGWTGKNTCVLNQQLGSWLLLGVIVTSLEPAPSAQLQIAADRCGSCTRCLDACPTNALVAPRQMDASLCISYLTIELKGPIPEPLRQPIGRQVFGCDICQDVCPWNRRAPVADKPGLAPRPELINPSLHWLAGLDNASFKRLFQGSPLERTKLRRIVRNVAIAMGNSADPTFIPTLKAWAEGEDTLVAEAATWALGQLTRAPDEPASI